MWSHYADQFQGVCLGLDPTKFNNGLQHGGFEVHYPSDRQHLPPSYYDCWQALSRDSDSGHQPDPASGGLYLTAKERNARKLQHYRDLLRYKSPAWAYEKEVRMIYDLAELAGTKDHKVKTFKCGSCDKKDAPLDQCNHQVYRDTINLPTEAIRAVIFGTDCSPQNVRRALDILSDSSYAGVERYWSSLDSSKYAVQYEQEKKGKDYIAFIQQHRAEEFADAKQHLSHDGEKMSRHLAGKGINFVLKTAPKAELGGYTVPLIGKMKKTPAKRKK